MVEGRTREGAQSPAQGSVGGAGRRREEGAWGHHLWAWLRG